MYWETMNDFLHMGGYGFYVWMSFGITFFCMAVELLLLRARKLNNDKAKDLL